MGFFHESIPDVLGSKNGVLALELIFESPSLEKITETKQAKDLEI